MPSNTVAKVDLWGSYLDGKAIIDPYYGGIVRILLPGSGLLQCSSPPNDRRVLRTVSSIPRLSQMHF